MSRNILTFALSMTQDQRRRRGEKVIPLRCFIFVSPSASHVGVNYFCEPPCLSRYGTLFLWVLLPFTLRCFILVRPLASHVGMIDFMVMSLLCGTLQCMVLCIEKFHNWDIYVSFDIQFNAESTSGTFDLYLASENGGWLIEWEDHCKERCLNEDQVSILI